MTIEKIFHELSKIIQLSNYPEILKQARKLRIRSIRKTSPEK
ncbi:hypothetical protein RINTHM_6260 [Richelia intracellularis HM01]|nr:hypothetical protein RINTHM_6260 [Richelia intracellularis HM01]